MSEKYDEYLKTDYWKAVTLAVKKRAGYRCQLCNSQHDLQAHHRTYDHRGKELEFLDDLVCLCRRCHGIFHGTIQVTPPLVIPPEPVPNRRGKRGSRLRKGTIDHEKIAADMPAGTGEIELTWELIRLCRTTSFGLTNATLREFGLTAPLVRG